MPSTRIILVRHGPTEWSELGRFTGRTDIPLTVNGRTAANRIQSTLKAILDGSPTLSIDLRSSPLQRATETAKLALPGRETAMDDRLLEWDYGHLEGLQIDEIRRLIRRDWSILRDSPPNGESSSQVLSRCRSLIDSLQHDVTVMFGHGHILKALASYLLTDGLSLLESLYLGAGGICIIDRIDGAWCLTSLDNSARGSQAPAFL